jgi:hypothetical protein
MDIETIKNSLSAKRPGRTLLIARIFSPKPKTLGELVDRVSLAVIYFGAALLLTSWSTSLVANW